MEIMPPFKQKMMREATLNLASMNFYIMGFGRLKQGGEEQQGDPYLDCRSVLSLLF